MFNQQGNETTSSELTVELHSRTSLQKPRTLTTNH
ncbi:hypothetical protein NC653_021049 [Populus alba x Populus x berolinensis]|uniref:Uncharacterized protein n=1 Tax=Populus alba x Populus x berolinensis TaxID=444605 RepID=A0AAD6MLY6_9ROSI|nr:hypothetical protein NC653_021049 [Populus alba x Populus x berolinensis]